MDKQIENIAVLDGGNAIRLKNGRVVPTKNNILCTRDGIIYLVLNRNLICSMSLEHYFSWSLWAHRLTFSHYDLNSGVVAYDNGYEHKSLAALFMQTKPKQKVGYHDDNHFNLCPDNLYIKGSC